MSQKIMVEFVDRRRPRKLSKVLLDDQKAFDVWLDRNVNSVVMHGVRPYEQRARP